MGHRNTLHDGILITLFAIVAVAGIMTMIVFAPTVVGLWIMTCLFIALPALAVAHVVRVVYDGFFNNI